MANMIHAMVLLELTVLAVERRLCEAPHVECENDWLASVAARREKPRSVNCGVNKQKIRISVTVASPS
jgi:hypothetical protein